MATLRETRQERTVQAILGAALDLFAEHGRDAVTVSAIAEAAEVGERTFYRYFRDKDDILFRGEDQLCDQLAATLGETPPGRTPLDGVTEALVTLADSVVESREQMRTRAAIIAASAPLREREAAKQQKLGAIASEALTSAGTPPGTARLLAALGTAAFTEGSRRWLDADDDNPLAQHVKDALADLRAAVA